MSSIIQKQEKIFTDNVGILQPIFNEGFNAEGKFKVFANKTYEIDLMIFLEPDGSSILSFGIMEGTSNISEVEFVALSNINSSVRSICDVFFGKSFLATEVSYTSNSINGFVNIKGAFKVLNDTFLTPAISFSESIISYKLLPLSYCKINEIETTSDIV